MYGSISSSSSMPTYTLFDYEMLSCAYFQMPRFSPLQWEMSWGDEELRHKEWYIAVVVEWKWDAHEEGRERSLWSLNVHPSPPAFTHHWHTHLHTTKSHTLRHSFLLVFCVLQKVSLYPKWPAWLLAWQLSEIFSKSPSFQSGKGCEPRCNLEL